MPDNDSAQQRLMERRAKQVQERAAEARARTTPQTSTQENYNAARRTEEALRGTGLPPDNFTTTSDGALSPATQIVPDNRTNTFGTNNSNYTFSNPISSSIQPKYTLSTTDALKVARDKDGNIGFKPDGTSINNIDTNKPFSVPEKSFTAKNAKDIARSSTTATEQQKAVEKKLRGLAAKQNAFNKAKNTHISALTDADIINIAPEYIISFTLQDSDREVYNMYQVGGDAFMGILDPQGDNNVASICASIPDLSSIIQFGMRPHPGTIQSPLVQNQKEAQQLGMMLVLQSQANRYSGTLTAIDEPTLRVGDPVRIHMYDEHPQKPITVKFTSEKTENIGAKKTTTEESEENRSQTGKVLQDSPPVSAFDPLVFPEQAVFYVTNVERSIDPSGTSTMTLQLKAGRMMGAWSVYEIFQTYYENYYWWDVQHRDDYLDGNNPLGDEKTDKKSPYWQYDHSIKDNKQVKAQQQGNQESKSSQGENNSTPQPKNSSAGGATNAPSPISDKSFSPEENPPTSECETNNNCGNGCDCDCNRDCDCNSNCDCNCNCEEPPNQIT